MRSRSSAAVLAVAVALVLACAAPAAAADPRRRLPGATSRRLLGAGPKLVATCSKRSFKAGALEDVFGTPKTKVEVLQPDPGPFGVGAFAVLKGALGREYVESYTAINALSGGAFFEPLGLVSHFHMGTCETASAEAPPPPVGTAIIPGVTPLNGASTGAHWLNDPLVQYGDRANEMWFTADLPSAGPRGKLPRGGVESETKDWLFPGKVFPDQPGAACIAPPPAGVGPAGEVNRGFQGDLPGSVVIHAVAYDPATAIASRPQWACCQLSYTRRFFRNWGDQVVLGPFYVPPPSVRTRDFKAYAPAPFKRESRCREP